MSFIINKQPKVISSVRNPMGIEIIADPSWATYDDYQLKLVLKYETDFRSGTFITSDADIPGRVNIEGNVIFDISGLLGGILSPDRPDLNSSADAVLSENMNKRYQFRIEEYKDGVLDSSFDSTTKHVIRAGFADNKKQYAYDWTGSLLFLTHQPRNKRILKDSPEYLSYFAWSAGELTITVDVTYEDGTQLLNHPSGFAIDVEEYDVVNFAVKFERLGLHLLPKAVKSWELWVDSDQASKPISERMGYYLDDICTPIDRYYIWENTLGGYDNFRTTGELSFAQNHKSQVVEKILSPFAPVSDRSIHDTNVYQQTEVLQHSGYVNYDEALWLRDLYMSRDAYRIGDLKPNHTAEGDLFPIRIPPGQYPIRADNAFMEGLKFNYQEGHKNKGL